MHIPETATSQKPMLVPVPMFIPVPIPIPIPTCLTALSQALLTKTGTVCDPKQGHTTSHNVITNTACNQSTAPIQAEKRYVLLKQPTSDAPE